MLKIKKTKFKDLLIISGKTHYDKRGFLREMLLEKIIKKKFKFHIVSSSKKGVLRGLHFQTKNPQGKLLCVLKGKISDVALDLRKNSKTYLQAFKCILSDKNNTFIYIPPGFAHGFYCHDKENLVLYGCTNYRDKKSEKGILWNDKDLKIKWPCKKPILSEKDKKNLSLKNYLTLKNGKS